MFYLADRGVVKITGVDAKPFLQGLITNDINKLQDGGAIYAAMLTPQGKYLFDFIIYQIRSELFLDVEISRIPALVKRLNMYKLRSQLEIEDITSKVFVYASENEGISDPRNPKMGKRLVSSEKVKEPQDFKEYEKRRIKLGVIETKDLEAEQSFIMQNSFEEIHGVDFNKGCYVGQEVTARTKYKGGVKKKIYVATSHENLPPTGTAITANDKQVGVLRTVVENIALAHCDIELVETAVSFKAGDVAVSLALPA